jgi:glycosyltransferase involved in cell wall biosynthesis
VLHVMMLGLRGFPGVQGGVEAHAERLCPVLTKLGCRVEVIVRSTYMHSLGDRHWEGVRYLRLWSPRSGALETVVHSFLGVLVARWHRPDVLHIQAIGPALMAPLARMLGLRVVVTHHGPDYDREKWGRLARWTLRAGEVFGMRFAHKRIVISRAVRNLVRDRYDLEANLVPNGADLPELPSTTGTLERFGLTPRRYVLIVSRLVPEKRHKDLIAAFATAKLNGWKLAVVGASDHRGTYGLAVGKFVDATSGAIMTGFQTGLALSELYAHAGMFVLPSSHEGLPIALIEALSYGLPVIASDIPAHLEIGLDQRHYFRLGDVSDLADRMEYFAQTPWTKELQERTRRRVAELYDWRSAAEQTLRIYCEAVNRRHGAAAYPFLAP